MIGERYGEDITKYKNVAINVKPPSKGSIAIKKEQRKYYIC